MATDKNKISAYLTDALKNDAKKLAEARGISLSALIAIAVGNEIRAAKKEGELE